MEHLTKILRQWLAPIQKDLPDLYLVGGAVRDHILSRISKDIDLVCHDAENVARKLASAQNATVVPFEKKADEPCFRIAARHDPGLFIDITPIRGGSVFTDLERRDFTINAIAIQVKKGGVLGHIIDPLNGADDIKHGVIRTTGPDVFTADPLRILRAVRFSAKLGFTVKDTTTALMKANASLLKDVAAERILVELIEIFKTGQSAFFVGMMDNLGILEIIFPEIMAMKGSSQNYYHHLDVWNHSLVVLEHCEYIVNHLNVFFGSACEKVSENLESGNRLPLLKLGAMLHDVGKPVTRFKNKHTGRINFHGHDREGGEIVAAIVQRLRMSRQDQEFVHTLATEHMNILRLFFNKADHDSKLLWFRKMTDNSIPAIIMGMADIKGTSGPASDSETKERHIRWSADMVEAYYGTIKEHLEQNDLISGKDLIAEGMLPGPEMGSILRKVRKAQDLGRIVNREEALVMAKKLRV
ncbi:MAG: HD domain-containing protein [Desulfobacteraceae bacterium]|nr:HD domain-containing protein [Desulfobacteraceae bacterium]